MNRAAACFAIALALPICANAQDNAPPTFRLQIRMLESGNNSKPSGRDYTLIVQNKSRAKINASRRLPFYTSSKGETREVHTAALGSIIECVPEDAGTSVRLDCAFESSYVPSSPTGTQTPVGFLPIVNSRQVSTTALVPLGTEVQLARLDDPASGNRLEIYVTVQKLGAATAPAAR